MSRFPPWHFRSMDLGEVHVDPVHDEFFKAQDLADALVRESIQNLDLGENKREADRTAKPRYVLSDLPWSEQRALIERLYALRREFQFEKLGRL